MELKNYFAQDSQGNAQPNATCYLYAVGTETIVTGLVDVTDTPLANPFNSDPYGLIQFKAPNGIYDLRVVSGVRDYRIRVQSNDLDEYVTLAEAAVIDSVASATESQASAINAGISAINASTAASNASTAAQVKVDALANTPFNFTALTAIERKGIRQ